MTNQEEEPLMPPSLIGGSTIKKTDVPYLIELGISSEKYKFTLTELSSQERQLLTVLYAYCERYKLPKIKAMLDHDVIMRVSHKRKGRLEFLDSLKIGSNADRTIKSGEALEQQNRRRI